MNKATKAIKKLTDKKALSIAYILGTAQKSNKIYQEDRREIRKTFKEGSELRPEWKARIIALRNELNSIILD